MYYFSKYNKSCWDEVKIFLKLDSKTKLACKQYKKKILSTHFYWEILRSKVNIYKYNLGCRNEILIFDFFLRTTTMLMQNYQRPSCSKFNKIVQKIKSYIHFNK